MTTENIPALKDLMGAPLKKTGADVPDGTYAGTLFGFGEPFFVPVSEQFRREGGPTKQLRMELRFAVETDDGLQEVDLLVGVPEGGAANQRSNLYKALKAMRGGDRKFFTDKGNFVEGITLESFIGSGASVQVKHNKKEFPTVEAVAGLIKGTKAPSLKDCEDLKKAAEADDLDF